MRVLFWSELFWPYMGGAQFFALKLLLGLRERGHEFIVVTRQDDPDLPQEACFKGFPIYRFPFYTALADDNVLQLLAIRQQVAQLKRRFAPELVHVNCFGVSVLFHLDTTKAHSAPLLVTLHSEKYDSVVKHDTLLERTLHAADWVTAPSARTVEYARQLVPNFVLPASHIYNGLEMPPVLPTRLPIQAPRLLCLGRLVPPKGFDLAVTALAAMTGRFPQVRLVIAGDGPARPELEQQTADLGLSGVVDFLGWVAPEHVPALINTATVVVVPSRGWESLPFVALEAACMARPVVAARDAGLPEVVVHQKTGLLVEKEDSIGLARALTFLLEHPEVAVQMGQAARQRVQEVFSLERCIDAYDALYQKLGKKVA
jgi:glycogen(starch) synthase